MQYILVSTMVGLLLLDVISGVQVHSFNLEESLLFKDTDTPKFEINEEPLDDVLRLVKLADKEPRNENKNQFTEIFNQDVPDQLPRSRVCCWDSSSYPVIPPITLPTWPPMKSLPTLPPLTIPMFPTLKPIPALNIVNPYRPLLPEVKQPSLLSIKSIMANYRPPILPALQIPTYPPIKPLPTYPLFNFPTWAPTRKVSIPDFSKRDPHSTWNRYNYSWTIPTYPPYNSSFQVPFYPIPKFEAPHKCSCNYQPNSGFFQKPQAASLNVNNIFFNHDTSNLGYETSIKDVGKTVVIEVNNVGVDGSEKTFGKVEVPSQLRGHTQLFDIGNTETINNFTIVVLNNCEKAESDISCTQKNAYNYIPSEETSIQKLSKGNDFQDEEINELLSTILEQVSTLGNENIFLLTNDQLDVSTNEGDTQSVVLTPLKPDIIAEDTNSDPVDILELFGMPSTSQSLKRVVLNLNTTRSNDNSTASNQSWMLPNTTESGNAVDKRQSNTMSPPKTNETEGSSTTPPPKETSTASQVNVPGSVGVADALNSVSPTSKPSRPETTTLPTATKN